MKRPELGDMKTWTERLGHTRLRSFIDKNGHFWLEQNPAKASKWAELARAGHDDHLGIRGSWWSIYRPHADRQRDLYAVGGDQEVFAGGTETCRIYP